MRISGAICMALICAGAASAQQVQQGGTIQMQCRDISSAGNFVGPDEVLINGMACKPVKPSATPKVAAAAQLAPAPSQPPEARSELAPATAAVPATATAAIAQPGPDAPAKADDPPAAGYGQIWPGARIVIAPMGGFETYFAAAVREKKVPVTLTLDRDHAQFFVVSTQTEWHGFVYGSGGSASWNQNGGSATHGSAASSTRGLEASIMLIDAKTKDVVWAYEVHKSSHGALLFGTHAARGQQSLAEACAKHLKEFIEKRK